MTHIPIESIRACAKEKQAMEAAALYLRAEPSHCASLKLCLFALCTLFLSAFPLGGAALPML